MAHPLVLADRSPHPGAVATASDTTHLYTALLARDPRFDGRFFVGVTSTHIYCRPVCRVRAPLARNCRFFENAAGAEAAGFRPCLRCRPELAPGLSLIDSPNALAQHAARMIQQAVREGESLTVPALAARLGITDRHLRRIFLQAHGVSPLDYLSTQRLLLAKQLLTDTVLPITQVALASGFGSVRRFNALFVERYGLKPGGLRRTRTSEHTGPQRTGDVRPIALQLTWRPPYDAAGVLHFFAQRAIPGMEAVVGDELRFTIALTQRGETFTGWIAARLLPAKHAVDLRVSPTLAPVLGMVVQRVRSALDLDADPAPVDAALARLPVPVKDGVRVPGSLDGFAAAVRIVLGQQVSVAAARTLTGRLVQRFGTPVATPFDKLGLVFPSASVLAAADPAEIGQLGIVRQRVRALQALATEVAAGRIALHPDAPLTATLDALRALPGIGEWTAQLIALRVLAWPDAFPATDLGLLNALGTRDIAAVSAMAEAWRPWRAYAVIRLWQTLETSA